MNSRANMMDVAKRLEGIQEYYFATKLREIATRKAEGHPVLNLGIGSPDLPPAPEVLEALNTTAQLPTAHGYQGYSGIPALRQAFAGWYDRYYGVSLHPDVEILPLMGSKEGIVHIAMTYLEAGTVALVPDPGYPAYRAASMLAGAEVRTYDLREENGWFPDFEALEAMDHSRTKLMWVNYPHMPTGTAATKAVFERLIDFGLRHNIMIVNDNPYSFIGNDQPLSILSIPRAKEVAMELNSLSKSHNMAGWRVGMLAGMQVNQVLRFKSNMDSGMFLPVQMAAIAALNLPPEWYRELNAIYNKRQKIATRLLETVGCEVAPGQQGLFVWGKVAEAYGCDGFKLSDELLYRTDVFITPGGIFGKNGDAYVRISLCSGESVFEEAIERINLNEQIHKL